MCTNGRHDKRGFTLIELIFFIVVVSIGLVGILSVLNLTARHSSDPLYPKQALAVAETLMEEIQLKGFSIPASNNFAPSNPPLATERQNFDDVLDFNNYGVGIAGIHDIDGNAVAALAGYQVQVSIGHPGAALNGIATANIWEITVAVTDPGGTVYTFTGYRLNYD